jgi:N-methylhydantoinase B
MEHIKPGQTITNMNPGGGGYGNPHERPIEKVVSDVKNGLVSLEGAREDYGVVINAALQVDTAATSTLRGN